MRKLFSLLLISLAGLVLFALFSPVDFFQRAKNEVFASENGLADSPWPVFHHDARHTGRSPYNGPETPTLKWSYEMAGIIIASPVIAADGTIYLGSHDCQHPEDQEFYAINLDGSLKWSFPTDLSIYRPAAIAADGTIYVGEYDCGYLTEPKLYALNPDSSLKWTFTPGGIGGGVGSSPMIAPVTGTDGTIYVGFGHKLYALNPDGSVKWEFVMTSQWLFSSSAIGSDGTIYVGSEDNKLYAINPDSSLKWSFSTEGNIESSPAIAADGTIYVGSHDSKLYAINPDSSLKWSFATGGAILSSPAIGLDGTVYVGSADNNLYAINPDGTLKWKFETGDRVFSSPAIDSSGTIYVGSFDHNLYAINPDGTLKWSSSTENIIYSSPAIGADGTIYVGSWDKKLYAIGPGSVSPIPTYNVAVILAEPLNVPHDSVAETYQPCKLLLSKYYPYGHSEDYYYDLAYCVADYHKENSFGTVNLDFKIFDNNGNWFKTSKNEEEYLGNERGFITEVIDIVASKGIDLSNKDIVIVIHSGTSYQKAYSPFFNRNPKKLRTLAWPFDKIIVAEDDLVGAFSHEIGHIIGTLITPYNTVIPDLKPMGLDTKRLAPDPTKAGDWDIMAEGSWNEEGNNPPHMSSYTKEFLQWLQYDIYPKSAYGEYWINSLETSKKGDGIFRYNLNDDTDDESQKYYILEARNKNLKTWDSSLPKNKALVLYYIDTMGYLEYGYALDGSSNNQSRKITIPAPAYDNIIGFNDGVLNPFDDTYRDFNNLVKFTTISDRQSQNRYEVQIRIEEITNDSFIDKFLGIILKPKLILEQKIKTNPAILNPTNIVEFHNDKIVSLEEQIGTPIRGPETITEVLVGLRGFSLSLSIPFILLSLLLLHLDKKIPSRWKSEISKKILKIIFKTVWATTLIIVIVFITCLLLVPIFQRIEPRPPSPPPGVLWVPSLQSILPDLDLHLFCKDGSHIGMNYETGEYEIQIAEAIVSGDNQNIPEWIFIPEDITNCRFVVSSYDNQRFLEENPEIAQELGTTTDSYEIYARYIDPATDIYTSQILTNQPINPDQNIIHQVEGTTTISVSEGAVYNFSGFSPPIKSDGSGVYKQGRTLPIKFQLTDANNNYIPTATAELSVAKISNGVVGSDEVPLSTSAADTGDIFRYDIENNQYIYNFSTDTLSTGSWQLEVVLDNGKSYTVIISIR